MATSNPQPRRDLYREITDKIIAAMESGKMPWQRPWNELAELGMPKNGSSSRPYNGVNSVLLFLESQDRGYSDNRWMTFKQASEAGYKVKKGERSVPVYFYKKLELEDRNLNTGEVEKKSIPYLTEYRVFNAEQIEGMPSAATRPVDWNPIEEVEKLVSALNIDIRHGGNRAFYAFAPSQDFLQIPHKSAFPNAAAYASVVLHEVCHWTGGGETRLNRKLSSFDDDPISYAREELRAHLASAFLSAELGVPNDMENHAAYLNSWLRKVLQDDKHEIFRAARDATQICNFIMGRMEEVKPSQTASAQPTPPPIIQLSQEQRYRQIGEKILAQARSQNQGGSGVTKGGGMGLGR